MTLLYDEIPSPIGTIVLVVSPDGVCALEFEDCRDRMRSLLQRRFGHVEPERRDDPSGCSTRVRALPKPGRTTCLMKYVFPASSSTSSAATFSAFDQIMCEPGSTWAYVYPGPRVTPRNWSSMNVQK